MKRPRLRSDLIELNQYKITKLLGATQSPKDDAAQIPRTSACTAKGFPGLIVRSVMLRLNDLPDDILVSIFSACDIDTILTTRLTCRTFSAIVGAYITTLAPKAARLTYPDCNVLLKPPKEGYSLKWLRSRIPAQLASIALDKDKMRRTPCPNSAFPYGIPSESDCKEAQSWRDRIASGWCVLRSLYLISKQVYTQTACGHKRPDLLRRASSGVRGSHVWQVMSCPYPGCTQHGMKHLFDSKKRRRSSGTGHNKTESSGVHDIRQLESKILEARLALIERLSDQQLFSYVCLWRTLLATFRPYARPGARDELLHGWQHDLGGVPSPNWTAMIGEISQGCSWLNWFVLHIGPSPFAQQWSLDPAADNPHKANLVRDMIWKALSSRTSHQIETEREFVCKLEFEVRKRCLTSERRKSLMAELNRGRTIRTISFDCMPWGYDPHPMLARNNGEFPWYAGRTSLWLNEDLYLRLRPVPRSIPGMWKINLVHRREDEESVDEDECENWEKGPLENVPYLVHLGIEAAEQVWPACTVGGTELAL